MFEKDAEEIANKKLCATMMCYNHCNFSSPKHHRCGDWHRCYEIAKDGAEFGYNKANEWHYVKDGDLPTEITEKPYLVALKSEYTNDFSFEIDIWCWSLHCFASNNPKKVYAWKEIVLPKESE